MPRSSRSDTSALVPNGPSDRGSRGVPSSGLPPSNATARRPAPTHPATTAPPDTLTRRGPPAREPRGRRTEPPRARPVDAPPYHAASKSSVAAAKEALASGRAPGDVPDVLPCRPTGLLGDGAASHEVGHERPVTAAQPLRPPTRRLQAGRLGSPLLGGSRQLDHDVGLVRRHPGGEGHPTVAHQEVDHTADRGGQDHPGEDGATASADQAPERAGQLVPDPPHDPIRERFGGSVVAGLGEDLVGEVTHRRRVVIGRRQAHQAAVGNASMASSSRSSPSVRTRRSR